MVAQESLACFGGEPHCGATKTQNISKPFDEKSEIPFSLDRAWSQDSNESKKPQIWYNGWEKGHFSVGDFIGCSVCHLHVLVGNRNVAPPEHKISQNRSMKNLKTHFLWIEHGLRIQMSPRNHISGLMAGRKGQFSVGQFICCSVCHLHVLVGNRTVVPPKHKISQNRSMKNLKTHFLWMR